MKTYLALHPDDGLLNNSFWLFMVEGHSSLARRRSPSCKIEYLLRWDRSGLLESNGTDAFKNKFKK